MFGYGKPKVSPVKAAKQLEQARLTNGETPAPAGYDNVTHIYYAAFHQSDAALRAARQDSIVKWVLIAALIGAIWTMLPLRRTETRYIEVETTTGRAVVTKGPNTALAEMTERLQVKTREYFLREFVSALVTLDARTIKERIPFAASMLQGKKAENAFNEYVYMIEKIPQKIAENPSLTREFRAKGEMATSADGKQAFIRFDRIEKINGAEQNVTPMLVTIEFAVLPEEPGKEKPLNPMGIRVLYFTVALDQ
jgi:type IV secretory pathway component VirB8